MAIATALQRAMAQIIPYLMQLEMTKEQSKIWLDKSLKEYEAYGKQQEEAGKAQFRRGIFGNISDPKLYDDYPYPVESAIMQAKVSQPELFAESGLVAPETGEFMKRLQAALNARTQSQIMANAGLQPQYEDLYNVAQAPGYGADDLKDIGEQMARVQGTQQSEKNRQTDESGIAMRGKELEQRVKEYALQFSPDMTPKEARERLAKLYDEYRSFQKSLDSGSNPLSGLPFGLTLGAEEEKKHTQRAMDSMRREIESIEHKYGGLLKSEYEGAAQELMVKYGWTRETLTNAMSAIEGESKRKADKTQKVLLPDPAVEEYRRIINYLWKQGFNPDTLLQYLDPKGKKK